MYGNQISKIIKNDKYAKDKFLGVYAIDTLPTIRSVPAAAIVNTDPSYLPGSHWVAFYIDKNQDCFFFDSYGNHPNKFGFGSYFRKYKNIYHNDRQLQSKLSKVCGNYCILFIVAVSRGVPFKTIIDVFSKKNFKFNDFIVENLINIK
jgi:hypothetical protein